MSLTRLPISRPKIRKYRVMVIAGGTSVCAQMRRMRATSRRAMDLNRVFAALNGAGIRVRSMRTKSNRLEELFVRLTGDDAAAKREQAA